MELTSVLRKKFPFGIIRHSLQCSTLVIKDNGRWMVRNAMWHILNRSDSVIIRRKNNKSCVRRIHDKWTLFVFYNRHSWT